LLELAELELAELELAELELAELELAELELAELLSLAERLNENSSFRLGKCLTLVCLASSLERLLAALRSSALACLACVLACQATKRISNLFI
jgi:hypothetical protein